MNNLLYVLLLNAKVLYPEKEVPVAMDLNNSSTNNN